MMALERVRTSVSICLLDSLLILPVSILTKFRQSEVRIPSSNLHRSTSIVHDCFILPGLAGQKNRSWPVEMERSKARAHIFPATTIQIPTLWPTGAGELSGPDP